MKILEVVKDTGGANATRPVGDQLVAMGHEVFRFANGVSIDYLRAAGKEVTHVTSVEQALWLCPNPDVLLTSMCSDGGVGRDLVPVLRGKALIVAIQDQWWSRVGTGESWCNRTYRPDYLVVNDKVGSDIVKRAWPGFHRANIQAFGFAALDALHGFDVIEARRQVRTHLRISPETYVVYVSGQLWGSGEVMEEITVVLDKQSADKTEEVVILPGKHPRLDLSNPEFAKEASRWEESLTKMKSVQHVPLPTKPSERIPELDLIAGADLVVSGFSTALMHAAGLRKPAISVMYKNGDMERQFQKETGGLIDCYPLVAIGAVAGARSRGELAEIVAKAISGELAGKLLPSQERRVIVDGGNARRIADFIANVA